MSKIECIEFPALGGLRYRKADDAWVVSGPPADISAMLRVGGAWVLTRKGPRVVLVDRAVKVDGSVAIVPQEPGDFEQAASAAPSKPLTELSNDELAAEMARRNGASKPATSGGRARGTRGTTSRGTSNGRTSTTAASKAPSKASDDVAASSAANDAIAATDDVSDDELAALMAG